VFTAEWNRHALETYVANHGAEHPIVGDITKQDAAEIPNHDLLVAGFPCQPFSISGVTKKNALGRKHGFADETQGTLFFDVARIIEAKRPRMFMLENVKNLRDHDKGRTFEIIRRTLADELGYTVSWRVVDSSPWVPQKRKRIFIVGVREGEAFDFDKVVIPAEGPKLGSILHREGEPGEGGRYADGGAALEKYTLTDNLWRYLQDYAAKHASKGNGFGFGLVGPDDVTRTISARYGKDGSEILVRQEGRNPRRLTPRECARLMGFDEGGNGRHIEIPVSDAQAYRQFGNSVVVKCVKAIADIVAEDLMNSR
jgi:DNA (cytosine-5)-methyltransferase 1